MNADTFAVKINAERSFALEEKAIEGMIAKDEPSTSRQDNSMEGTRRYQAHTLMHNIE